MKRFIITIHHKSRGPALKTLQKTYPKAEITECSIALDEFVQAAQLRHCENSDGEIEIDEPACMSECAEGVWIQAWVFVPGLGSQYHQPEEEDVWPSSKY